MGSTVSTPPAVMTQRLGGGLDHGAELPGIGLLRLHAVGVGARHDEVDVGQRVAEARRHGDVGQRGQAALAGLQVEQVHEVGAVAVVGVAAAHLHGRLAGAVVDREARRRRLARPAHELGRHVHEAGVVARAAAGQHDGLAFFVEHLHADVGQNAQGGVVDLLLLRARSESSCGRRRSACSRLSWCLLTRSRCTHRRPAVAGGP